LNDAEVDEVVEVDDWYADRMRDGTE